MGIGYIGGKLLAFPEFQRRLLELREGRLADELGQTEHASSVPPDQSLTPSYRPFDANLQTSQKSMYYFSNMSVRFQTSILVIACGPLLKETKAREI